MAMEEMSAQRKAAYFKWRQAEQEEHKGHHDRAVDLARSALEEDPEYLDVHMWLARVYQRLAQPRKASHELEEIIHINRDHAEAWELLRQVDPAAAHRLERLHDIAPDPFISKRTAPLTEDVGDISEFGDIGDDGVGSGLAAGEIGADPFYSGAGATSMFGDMDEDEELLDEPEPEPTPQAAVASSPAPAAAAPARTAADHRGGYIWEYDQDLPWLARWEAEPPVAKMTAGIRELWKERDVWDSVLSLCAHADKHLHPQIFEAAGIAAERLGVEMPELMVFPERCMHPVIIKDREPLIAIPTGLIRAMNPKEMIFQIGREIGHIHTGYLAQMQAVKIATNRKARLMGDLASTLDDFLRAHLKYWDEGLDRDGRERLKKLGHAWQQRCELSADRAGLVCCEGVEIACAALAKTTAKSTDEAATLSADRFLQQFEGRDAGDLAKIPVEESPSRNPGYCAYRIHMLKWWATTDECREAMYG